MKLRKTKVPGTTDFVRKFLEILSRNETECETGWKIWKLLQMVKKGQPWHQKYVLVQMVKKCFQMQLYWFKQLGEALLTEKIDIKT